MTNVEIFEKFERDGYAVLKQFFPLQMIEKFENSIHEVVNAELQEIGHYNHGMSAVQAMAKLEAVDKPRFFRIASAIGGNYDGLRLSTLDNLAKLAEELHARHSKGPLICSIIGLFWNQKDNRRLQYGWHQESIDYIDFDWSFHGWFPLFNNVTLERGPMVVAKGSHGKNYPYEMRRQTGAGTQLLPLIDVDATFEAVPLPVDRGDMILFHHSLIHKTGSNQTDIPRVSGILRFTPAITRNRYLPMIKYQYADENHGEKVRANAARYVEI